MGGRVVGRTRKVLEGCEELVGGRIVGKQIKDLGEVSSEIR